MEKQTESNRMREEPYRLITPLVVRVLTAIGLTDLSGDEVRQYRDRYVANYGFVVARALRILHTIGLTDLSDDEVNRYVEKTKNERRRLER